MDASVNKGKQEVKKHEPKMQIPFPITFVTTIIAVSP
jgi:hypothetical protein